MKQVQKGSMVLTWLKDGNVKNIKGVIPVVSGVDYQCVYQDRNVAFPGVLNSGGCHIFEKTVTATGLTEDQAHHEGYNTVCATVDSRSQHGMIPGFKPWTLKLVFDRETQKLIGGQIVSDAKAPAKEIDAVSALILGEKKIAAITTVMIASNPDIASEPSMEPISIAAEQALQKLSAMGDVLSI